MRGVVGVAAADFRERVRGFSFVVIVALAVLLGYAVATEVFVVRMGDYRGVYNAAWIGTLMATTLGFFLSLVGFYLVRGTVQRDAATGVGEVLAATPLRTGAFVVAKFVSNAAVLLLMVAVLAASALVMLLVHGEDRTLDLPHLLLPFLVLATPVALLVAAFAILFDCLPPLRETAGNVVYFVAWTITLPFVGSEMVGFASMVRAMTATLDAVTNGYGGGIVLGIGGQELQTFAWSGFAWGMVALPRLGFVAASLGLVALAALAFDRFDPARQARRRVGAPRRATHRGRTPTGEDEAPPAEVAAPPAAPPADAAGGGGGGAGPRPPARARGPRGRRAPPGDAAGAGLAASATNPPAMARSDLGILARLLAAEFLLLAKGRSLAWYLVAVGLIVACLLAPVDAVQRWLLPLAWLWPLPLWSEMGARDTLHRTRELLFSAPAPVLRQLPATWLAGVALALVTGSGALARLASEPGLLPGLVAGTLFIPSLALLLGVASGSGRAFQVAWMLLWYLGAMNGVPAFDVVGATAAGIATGAPWAYAIAGLGLAALAAAARWHQVRPLAIRP